MQTSKGGFDENEANFSFRNNNQNQTTINEYTKINKPNHSVSGSSHANTANITTAYINGQTDRHIIQVYTRNISRNLIMTHY